MASPKVKKGKGGKRITAAAAARRSATSQIASLGKRSGVKAGVVTAFRGNKLTVHASTQSKTGAATFRKGIAAISKKTGVGITAKVGTKIDNPKKKTMGRVPKAVAGQTKSALSILKKYGVKGHLQNYSNGKAVIVGRAPSVSAKSAALRALGRLGITVARGGLKGQARISAGGGAG